MAFVKELARNVTSSNLPVAGLRRGSTREETDVSVYRTKPACADNSKEGTAGREIKLSSNYFRLINKPEFEFSEYHVKFEPELDIEGIRKAFMAKQKDVLGGYLYNGQNLLYLTRRLPKDRNVFSCETREGHEYRMTIEHTGNIIQTTDGRFLMILNLILRRTMDGLKLQLVGRNLYDPKNKVKFTYKLFRIVGLNETPHSGDNQRVQCPTLARLHHLDSSA